MSRDHTKLTLSANALKMLLEAGGPQFEVDLRQAVVANLFKRNIKTIMNDEVMRAKLEEVRIAAKREFDAHATMQIGSIKVSPGNWGNREEFVLNSDLVKTLQKCAEDCVARTLHSVIDAEIKRIEATVPGMVEKKIAFSLDRLVRQEVANRLAKLAAE